MNLGGIYRIDRISKNEMAGPDSNLVNPVENSFGFERNAASRSSVRCGPSFCRQYASGPGGSQLVVLSRSSHLQWEFFGVGKGGREA